MYEVKSSADLAALRTEYLKLLESGYTGIMEVRVAPGKYGPTGWSLGPDSPKVPSFGITLTGTGAVIPVPSQLSGTTLRIEGLVLTGQRASSVRLDVGQSLHIVGAAVMGGLLTDPNLSAPYLEVVAHGRGGKKTPVTVTVEHSWFVRNFQQGAMPCSLLALSTDAREPGYFSEVVIRDSVFLGNAFSAELAIGYTQQARIERSIFYKTWAAGTTLSCQTSGAVVVKDSVLVAEDLQHLVQTQSCPPVAFEGTRIYARSHAAGTEVPKSMKIDPAQISDRKPIDATAPAADQAAKLELGLPPPSLRETLYKALRP